MWRIRVRPFDNLGGHTGGETPLPIPNREVKPARADGTRRATSRESRSPPDSLRRPRERRLRRSLWLVGDGGSSVRRSTPERVTASSSVGVYPSERFAGCARRRGGAAPYVERRRLLAGRGSAPSIVVDRLGAVPAAVGSGAASASTPSSCGSALLTARRSTGRRLARAVTAWSCSSTAMPRVDALRRMLGCGCARGRRRGSACSCSTRSRLRADSPRASRARGDQSTTRRGLSRRGRAVARARARTKVVSS